MPAKDSPSDVARKLDMTSRAVLAADPFAEAAMQQYTWERRGWLGLLVRRPDPANGQRLYGQRHVRHVGVRARPKRFTRHADIATAGAASRSKVSR